MSSQTDICNAALILLGAAPINAITDQTTSAIALNAVWDLIRDSELRKHRWKFSIARASLPALASVPASGPYTQQFDLPSDYLRYMSIGDSYPGSDLSDYRSGPTTDDFQIEGGMVLSNLSAPLSIRYIRRVTDATQWDPCFCDTVSARLAFQACYRITQSNALQKTCQEAYQQALFEAMKANALETPPEVEADDTWVTTRPLGSGGAANVRYG